MTPETVKDLRNEHEKHANQIKAIEGAITNYQNRVTADRQKLEELNVQLQQARASQSAILKVLSDNNASIPS